MTFELNPYPCSIKICHVKALPQTCEALTEDWKHGICIKIRRDLPDLQKISLLAHEVVHVLFFLEKYIETTLDQETRAYLTQFIMGKYLRGYFPGLGGGDGKKA